jgi:hypothetical protein
MTLTLVIIKPNSMGSYAACVRKLRKALGKDNAVSGYGWGWDAGEAVYVKATVKQVCDSLGNTANSVTIIQATGVYRSMGEHAFQKKR